LLRFWKVAFQTVAAPVLTALLYLLIFGHVLDDHVQVHGVRYTSFLIPGLVMMQVLQNAFANSSSSLIQAKITGSIVFVLLPPIPYSAFFAAYVLAALARGLMVGVGVLLATLWFAELTDVVAPLWVLVFAVLGGALFGALGMIAGIWSEKVRPAGRIPEFPDHAADHAVRRFLFDLHLPTFWQGVSHYNPVFYMIDGFRYGFFGVSDVAPETSLAVVISCFAAVSWLTLSLLEAGLETESLNQCIPNKSKNSSLPAWPATTCAGRRRPAFRGAGRQREFVGKNPCAAPAARLPDLLKEKLATGELHALSFKTLTPEEWSAQRG
jgi:ABC-2 type transport system permease protein